MRVLVVGAGISGLTSALELHRSGHEVTVMERHDGLRSDGYMIDFYGPGFDAAERMGLLPTLARIHQPIAHLVFVDTRSKVTAELPYARVRREVFRDRHFNFMRGALERVLADALRGGVRMQFGTTPVFLDPTANEVTVKTNRSTQDTYDLVIGADGFHSRVRNLAFLAGESSTIHLGSHTAAYIVDKAIAGAPRDAFVSLLAPGFTAAAYPTADGRIATFFLHRAQGWLADRSPEACRRELEATYRGRGWILDELLDAFPPDGNVYFDDVGQIETLRWSEGRVVLVGDAAGCVSLLAGQGASLAMFGAYVLARELSSTTSNVAAALERYEARVRPIVNDRRRAGARNVAWFLPRSRLGTMVRNQLTRAAATPPLSWLVGRVLRAARSPLD